MTHKSAYDSFIASDVGRKHQSGVRQFIDNLPEDEVEQMLITHFAAKNMGTVRRRKLMAELGITTPPPSEDAGKPYGERSECDFSGPREWMGS